MRRGMLHDSLKAIVLQNFDESHWDAITSRQRFGGEAESRRQQANGCCPSNINILNVACDVLNIDMHRLLDLLVSDIAPYNRSIGFASSSVTQNLSFQTWLSGVNGSQHHLLSSLMDSTDFTYEEVGGGILYLRYLSICGMTHVPFVAGVVETVARCHFDTEILMQLENTNALGDNHVKITWRIQILDTACPAKMLKSQLSTLDGAGCEPRFLESATCLDQNANNGKPYLGESCVSTCNMPSLEHLACSSVTTEDEAPMSNVVVDKELIHGPSQVSVSPNLTKEIFPYHIVVNRTFHIVQVGRLLPMLLGDHEHELVEKQISTLLNIIEPIQVTWEWKSLRKLQGQAFFVNPPKIEFIKLRTTMVELSREPFQLMFLLSPDVNNTSDLHRLNLTLQDLPAYSGQREVVHIRDRFSENLAFSLKLEVLTKKLQLEKYRSRCLLRTLVPQHVADKFEKGESVEPEFHEEVAMIFIGVAGYDEICEKVHPKQLIEMRNQLHSVLGHLCNKFDVFELKMRHAEFIGCCGLFHDDPNHPIHLANFAIAARHCARHIRSPLDNTPLELCIGIHAGQCMSGVYGMSTPYFTLFGDTVNTTSRHMSTCGPGKIQCSSMMASLLGFDNELFYLNPRGLVDMKGKGFVYTYWLDGPTVENHSVDGEALDHLDQEICALLRTKDFTNTLFFQNRNEPK